jgi:RNA polymerase sigma-70 factor (ECF subfamily)
MSSSTFRRVDRTRFKELTFPHLEFLYNMALKYTGKPYDAEDIVQETMYTAYRKFHQLRDEEKCRSWLFSILRTTFLREFRLHKKRPLLDDGSGYLKNVADESADSLAGLLEKKIDRQNVQQVLDRMSEKHKSPLILFYMEDMTYQEIADLLGIPIGTVMSRLARAKKQMKKALLKLMQPKSNRKKTGLLAVLMYQGVR